MSSDGKSFRILIIEDQPSDIYLAKLALEKFEIPAEIEIASDGEQAIERFQQASQAPIDLILLDLSLPRQNGLTVLEKIRNASNWQSIPVIIMTSAESPNLPVVTQWLGANLFFHKPLDLNDFMELGRLVRDTLMESVPAASGQG